MKITVAIPAYRRPKELRRAIKSVLQQTRLPDQIIVGDDSQDSEVEAVCQSFFDNRITYEPRRPILRMSDNWNFVTRWARDGKVALLEDDNFWQPDHLAAVVAAYERFPKAQFVHAGHREAWDEDGALTYYREVRPPWDLGNHEPVEVLSRDVVLDALTGGTVNSSTVVMDREALQRTQGFDCRFLMGMDTLMWSRLAMAGSIAYSGSVTVTYTYHLNNVSRHEIRTRKAGAQARASRRIIAREALKLGIVSPQQLVDWLKGLPPNVAAGVITAFAGDGKRSTLGEPARQVWLARNDLATTTGYLRWSHILGYRLLERVDRVDRLVAWTGLGLARNSGKRRVAR